MSESAQVAEPAAGPSAARAGLGLVALIAIVPVIVLFALIEKRLIGGLTAGAGK